jgi:AcrR family transcriptional regulator
MARTATAGETTDRRQRILDIATREFAAKGLAGTRVDVIAQKAGCNKQLIYYYFQSKDQLYDEVLATMMADTRR